MAELSPEESFMFNKWYGTVNLHLYDEFWADVYEKYKERDMPLPLAHNHHSMRRALELLECQPGECAHCCHYDHTPICMADLTRIAKHTKYDLHFLAGIYKNDIVSNMYIPTTGGCPFLENKTCTIYKARPSSCYFFPMQAPREFILANKTFFQQAQIRIACKPAVKLVRELITEALRYDYADGAKLMPDLTLISGERHRKMAGASKALGELWVG